MPGALRTIASSGRFTWQRSQAQRVYVYFTHGDVASNRVTIPARGATARLIR